MNDSLINTTTKGIVAVNEIVTTVVVGIIIFLVGLIIARIASKVIQRLLKDVSLDGTVKQSIGIKTSFERFLSGSVFFIIMMVFLVLALNYIGVTSLILNILSIALIIVVLVSLILTIKENIPNLVAYRTIRQKNMVKEGDQITIDNASGTIEEISLFHTKIQKQKDILYIPNSLFISKEWSKRKAKK